MLFVDGQNHYTTPFLPLKYATVVGAPIISAGVGYAGGNGLTSASSGYAAWAVKPKGFLINTGAEAFGGFYMLVPSAVSSDTAFWKYPTWDIELRVTAAGALSLYHSGSSFLTTASGVFAWNSHQFIELDITPNIGVYNIIVGGTNVATTSSGPVSSANETESDIGDYGNAFGSSNIPIFSNIYFNDYAQFGPIVVQLKKVNGAGRVGDFSFTGGASAPDCLNNVPPDPTKYIYDNVDGDESSFAMQDLASSVGSVLAVQLVACMKQDSGGSARNVGIGFGDGNTETFDGGHSLTTSYDMYLSPLPTNPITGQPFTVDDVDNMEAAVQVNF